MATTSEWIEGARVRTLPAAIAPVLAGAGVAGHVGAFSSSRTLLALVVALALQIGVNYSNDYSDGVRGTDSDENRVGPQRLVGSGAATPAQVKYAAFGCFGVAALAGLALVVMSGVWWLIGVGVACIAAAWFYTGGKHPYGYAGLGEVFVFVFFGLVATVGTTYVQALAAPEPAWWAGIFAGAFACAILVANNLRDIAGDAQVGKNTLAVRLGGRRTRWFFVFLIFLGGFALFETAASSTWWALGSLVALLLTVTPVRSVLAGARGPALIEVLKYTGLAESAAGILLFVLLRLP